jgi:nitrogen fixation/metabolism regulation signal transduction histidine kinase
MNLFKKLEIEWRILLLAAVVLLAFAFPLQSIFISKLQSTLQQSVDTDLENLLRRFLATEDDSVKAVVGSAIQRNRQWKALVPIIVEEQCIAMIILSFVLFITLLVLAFYALRRLTRPLRLLVLAAEQIGKGIKVSITGGSAGALGKLEKSMAVMQEELLKLREKAHAQGMETAWRDIARVMAHEIKNPLTPIQLSLDRIQEKIDEGCQIEHVELSRFVNRIGTQVINLEKLVDNFRSFAKEPEPQCVEVSVKEICKPLFRELGTVDLSIDGDAIINADPHLLNRVFLNLWKNSLEAGASKIHIKVEKISEKVQISFADNGSGIPEEMCERVWVPYFTSKKGGTGLGLPVVKRMLQSMGISIRLESSTDQDNHGVTIIMLYDPNLVCSKSGSEETTLLGIE